MQYCLVNFQIAWKLNLFVFAMKRRKCTSWGFAIISDSSLQKMLIKAVGHILKCARDLIFLLLENNNTLLTLTEVQIWQFQERPKQPHTDKIFICSVLCGRPKENGHPREQTHCAVMKLRQVFTAPPVWTGLYINAQWVPRLIYTTANVLIWVVCLPKWHYKHCGKYSGSCRISINVGSNALKPFMSSFLQKEKKYSPIYKEKMLCLQKTKNDNSKTTKKSLSPPR